MQFLLWQAHILIWLQTVMGPAWQRMAILFSQLGNYSTYPFLTGFILLIGGTEYALQTGILAVLAMVNADLLKLLFLTKRPFETPYPIHFSYLESAAGASFPSGHAEVAMAVYALWAYALWQRGHKRGVLLLLFPLGIGLSRLYLGVHWPLDVFSGWIFGWVLYEWTIRRPGSFPESQRFFILRPIWWIFLLLLSTRIALGLDTQMMVRFLTVFAGTAYFFPVAPPFVLKRQLFWRALVIGVPIFFVQILVQKMSLVNGGEYIRLALALWLGCAGFVFRALKI
ncbi:hypothetical protein BM613_12575 [Sulfoacidibacillus thermotolerans]|uniref:Phosphatidic acid phosphatase type 2/haloperoxidase domain-containing protein n=2 Tax=Sulfoacidibacillus thermotolerans TaxID=1765684 RepID=A0A2U3D5X0_SULT2|nr:hypothetical protein BM613_12575 [Sulfoacidibacillus thermotolerans]